MDVSFSIPTWKSNELKNIDQKLEEEFYASTPYNLNDFKNPQHTSLVLFERDQQYQSKESYVKRRLTDSNDRSVAIFITYLYEFLNVYVSANQKNAKKLQKNSETQTKLSSDKSLLQPQSSRSIKYNQVDNKQNDLVEKTKLLRSLKILIYELEMCSFRDSIPSKFKKFYSNNLVKKVIFQYLNKCVQNVSLIEILPQNNQFLLFCLSLISRSIVKKYRPKSITTYSQVAQLRFDQEAHMFLDYFSSIGKSVAEDSGVNKNKKSKAGSMNLQDNLSPKSIGYQFQNRVNSSSDLFVFDKGEMKGSSYTLFESYRDPQQYVYFLLIRKESTQSAQSNPKKKSPSKHKANENRLNRPLIRVKSPSIGKSPKKKSGCFGSIKEYFSRSQKKAEKK